MTTHTPGPWRLDAIDNGYEINVDRYQIATVLTDHIGRLIGVTHDNARLIAAAPDLLAALKDIVASCQKAGVGIIDLSRGRHAIAKAEGR